MPDEIANLRAAFEQGVICSTSSACRPCRTPHPERSSSKPTGHGASTATATTARRFPAIRSRPTQRRNFVSPPSPNPYRDTTDFLMVEGRALPPQQQVEHWSDTPTRTTYNSSPTATGDAGIDVALAAIGKAIAATGKRATGARASRIPISRGRIN